MSTDIRKLLKTKYPIIQGGMAWISDASLAAAVSNAGGLGIIAAGSAPGNIVEAQIKKAKELTDKPFGVNVMLLSPFAEEVIDIICREGIKIITTGAGNPKRFMQKLKDNNITVIPVVPSSDIAKKMEKLGVDAVIAEGEEAGGHIGQNTTMTLVPQVVDAVNIPVIAAGGIADGRGVAAAYMLGANGIQVGTRFLVANECTVHQNYKDLVLRGKSSDTTVSARSTGHPVRSLKNQLSNKFVELESTGATKEKVEALGTGALCRAATEGDVESGSVMVGQIVGLVNKEESCHDIIQDLMNDAKKVLSEVTLNF